MAGAASDAAMALSSDHVLIYTEEWRLFEHSDFVQHLMSWGHTDSFAIQIWRDYIWQKGFKEVCKKTGKVFLWWCPQRKQRWKTDEREKDVGIQCKMDEESSEDECLYAIVQPR